MKATVTSFFAPFWVGCAINASLLAQPDNLRFEHLSEQQGLSHNSVTSIIQDQEGFMWFGTADGLNKYDGYTFTVLRYDPNDPKTTLQHNSISDIHEDRKGRLWITTYGGGFHQVDKRTGKVTRYEIKPTSSFEWNYLTSIYEDQEGNLWICGFGGLAHFDPVTEKFTLYPAPGKPTSGKASAIFSVVKDSIHRFWAGTTSGLFQFSIETGEFTNVVMDSSIVQQDFWCNYLHLDKDGVLWIGTDIGVLGRVGEGLFRMDTNVSPPSFTRYNHDGSISKKVSWNGIYEDARGYLWVWGSEGLHRIHKRTGQVLNFEYDPLNPGSLSHENISAVYQDPEGAYWIGSMNGIDKVKAHRKKFQTYQIIPAHPSDIHDENAISTLLEDHTGTIWLGNSGSELHGNSRGGLFQFDPEIKKIIQLSLNPKNIEGLAANHILSLYEDKRKQFWIGTPTALHLWDSKTRKFIPYYCEIPIWNMDQGPSGKLWVGGKSGMASFDPDQNQFKYYRYNPEDTTSLKHLFVYDILASRTGDIWAATGAGIARLNPETDSFIHYLSGPTPSPKHLNDNGILTLFEDGEGIIWIGTMKGGLNRFDPKNETFTHFTIREGLSSNTINSIIRDEKGDLWLGTSTGISCFNPLTQTFRNFDASDGLPDTPFGPGTFSRSGKLMFGSLNGLVIFDPDSIQENTTKPPVYITGFNVMEKPREVLTDKIELPYDENFLSFDFVALNYDAPEKNQYAYILEGVDKDWIFSGNRRYASYTNLDPGEYTFRVKASNNDGIWNEEGASVQFVILPPWWRTWWAYSLYALLALGILWSIRRYEIKRLKLRHRAEHLAEVDSLKTRFFANISHEFRTPLTLILGPLKEMYQGTFTGDRKAVFGVMIRNGQRLLNLINQLLDISKLEAGKMQLQAAYTDLVALLRHIASSYESLTTDKKIKYFFYPEMPELMVYVDSEKIEKIVHNLLSNAFKFTPQGGEVILHLKTQEKQWALISVKDTGTGIPGEELDKVFDRFYQVDSSQTRAHEGSGLGMALAKELAEMHHGKIIVESKEGKGTTFTVWLPLGKAHLRPEEIQEIAETETHKMVPMDLLQVHREVAETEDIAMPVAETNHPLILVVEDNTDMRQYIRSNLGDQYQIKEAANGKEGVMMAKELLPDLIISDVMMPEMDGYQLCEKIKTDELTSHIPVILLTAKADRQSKLTGLETGADDYLAKPFDAEELQLIVRNHIEERRKMRERFSRDITLEPRSISITSLDEKFLRKVLDIIEEHMADEAFTIEDLSKEAGYSQVQFYRKIKALSDQSPSQFLRTIRLKRAAAMLQQKSDTISQIAYGVGFNNLSYFNKCFKEQFGMTPGQYAATVQEVK